MEIIETLKNSLSGTFDTIASFIPNLIGALILLFIGWLIARAIKWALYKILKTIKFDNLADSAGVNGFLSKGGLKSDASTIISKLGYWTVMFLVLVTFFNALGLEVVSNLLQDVIYYIPNVIVACILLIVGMYLAKFVRGLVIGMLNTGEFKNSEFVGRLVYGAVMFFTIAIVFNQLGIAEQLVNNVVSIVLGGLGIALAIAFGLGGKKWAAGVIDRNLNSK
jgi:hypothetical protein